MEQATLPHGQALTPVQLRALHSNLNENRVSKLDKGGKKFSYLEGWDVKATLIKVFGYANFSAECLSDEIVREERLPQRDDPNKANWSISVKATYRLTIHQTGAIYTESAIANNKQPDWTEAADQALKSAQTDALKRCATYLGTQFGLSLYDSGRLVDIITTTLSPDQSEIMDDINTARTNSPEAKAALERLQARIKVHDATVTDVPTTPSEPTVTEVPTVIPMATVTSPVAAPVAKALENAERRAKELDAAEGLTPQQQEKRDKLQGILNAVDEAEIEARMAAPRKTGPRRGRTTKPTVTADKAAVARQALADAERATGTRPVGEDPYLAHGPDSPEFVMDDVHAIAEDTAR